MNNRFLLKTVLLLCTLVVGSGNLWAETATYQHVFSSKPSTGDNVTLSTVNWNIVATSLGSYNSANYAGVQVGTSKNDGAITLTSSSEWGTETGAYKDKTKIKEIRLWLNLGGTSVTPTVTIGGKSATSDGTTVVKNSSAGSDWTKATKVTFTPVSGGETGVVVINIATVKAGYICALEIDCEATVPGTTSDPSISGEESFLNSTTVTIANAGSADGAAIYYTLNGEDPTTTTSATCFQYSEPFTVNATTTVKAIAKHADDTNASSVVSKTFTKVTPMSVAEARKAIDAGTGTTGVYVQGIVCEGGSSLSSGAMNYWISDNGTATGKFEIYKGKSFDGGNFSDVTDVQVGDVVVVFGNIKKYNDTYEFDSGSRLFNLVRLVATPAFSPLAGAVVEGTKVTISCATDGATIYYTTDGTTPTASSSVYSEPITIDAAKTIKALAVKAGSPNSEVATADYTIAAPAEAPTFSVAAGTYYTVQSVTLTTTTDGASIYYTTNGDLPTTESTKYTGAISVDETMTVKAIAAKDGMASSSVAEATYTILLPKVTVKKEITFNYDEAPKTLAVKYENVSGDKPTVKYYESDGTTETTYDWFTAVIDGDNNLLITAEENEGDAARLGYVKILAKGVDNSDVSSELITVTQIRATVDYATLPFSFNDGKSGVEETTGLTHRGLGSDYSSAPRLKFDNTGDELILKIKEVPGTLSFDIKGNSFSDGTFKVQTSANGAAYTDIATYTALDDTQSEVLNNLPADVRYIKWVYTNKSSGNVALGNIKLSNTVDVQLAASGYASFCSPVALDLTPGTGYAAYAVTATSGATVTFSKISGAVPAGTPFILYGESGKLVNLPIATGTTTAVAGNMLVGTLAPTAITTVSGDFTNFGLSGGSFVKINDGTIPANKAYLRVLTKNIPVSAREFTIIFDDMETTGVNDVSSKCHANSGDVFDLQGRKVVNPSKGLYIVNGKKVFIP